MRTLSMADRDVRYSIWLMARWPGFALVAVLALAAGMAATLVAFTVVNALHAE
jgi:hypothetical protein